MEATVASAATTDIGAAASYAVKITGTTTITSFGTDGQGPRFVRFTGALTLTHNASSLILPGGANITTAAGDTCIAIPIPSGAGWYVSNYTRASGDLVSGTAVATTSGTAVDFTSIPSWVKRITVQFSGVSTNGTSSIILQLGDSGGVETSGYSSSTAQFTNGGSVVSSLFTSGFGVTAVVDAGSVISGSLELSLLSATANTWAVAGVIGFTNSTSNAICGGSKALSATLDRVRITTAGGVNTFDAGSVNVLYE
jgi:hypothetical protein